MLLYCKKRSNDNHDVVSRFDFAEITQDSDFALLGIGGNARCVDKVGTVDPSNFGKWALLRRLIAGGLLGKVHFPESRNEHLKPAHQQ